LSETRLPAAWALAEATATPREIAFLRLDDVDLDRQLVRLVGGGHLEPRSGELTDWGTEQLQRRIDHQDDPDAGLVYRGHGSENSAQASVSQAIRWSLVRAGLGADPLVKPSSIRAWRARSWAHDGVPIQEIAARLGMRSLDRVRALIGDERL
jgi:integrase/recombinase XerC